MCAGQGSTHVQDVGKFGAAGFLEGISSESLIPGKGASCVFRTDGIVATESSSDDGVDKVAIRVNGDLLDGFFWLGSRFWLWLWHDLWFNLCFNFWFNFCFNFWFNLWLNLWLNHLDRSLHLNHRSRSLGNHGRHRVRGDKGHVDGNIAILNHGMPDDGFFLERSGDNESRIEKSEEEG